MQRARNLGGRIGLSAGAATKRAKEAVDLKAKEVGSSVGNLAKAGLSPKSDAAEEVQYRRLSEVHDFSWSRELWAAAARRMLFLFTILIICFVPTGLVLLGYRDGHRGVDALYLLSATMTMVGYGDISPSGAEARVAFVALIIFGLIIIGFGLSFVVAYSMASVTNAEVRLFKAAQ